MPAGLHYDDERALDDPDSLSGIGHDTSSDSRLGPNVADLFNNPSSPLFQSTHPSDAGKYTLLFRGFSRHNATESIASASSDSSADSDTEAIELAALHMAREQPYVERIPSHGRFDSTASASSYGTSASKDEEEMRLRSAILPRLDPVADTSLARGSQDLHAPNPSEQEILKQAQDPPLTPMSPRQTRFPHRMYVPTSSHHDSNPKLFDGEEDLASLSPRELSVHHSPDIEHTSPIETDSLLPLQKNGSQTNLLPLPATAIRTSDADEPRTFTFSFSRLETSFHVVGVLITLFLIIFSVWLTLAKIKM